MRPGTGITTLSRCARLLFVVTVAGCTTSTVGSEGATTSVPRRAEVASPSADQLAAAQTLCPVMWAWVKDVGGLYNDTSTGLIEVPDAQDRRTQWRATFDAIEARNDRLLADVASLHDDDVLRPLVDDIDAGVVAADDQLDAMRQLLIDEPEVDEQPRHQVRAAQLAIYLEKVIDVAKPELAEHDTDGSLVAAFRSVASCQQSVKDADNGSTQSNG